MPFASETAQQANPTDGPGFSSVARTTNNLFPGDCLIMKWTNPYRGQCLFSVAPAVHASAAGPDTAWEGLRAGQQRRSGAPAPAPERGCAPRRPELQQTACSKPKLLQDSACRSFACKPQVCCNFELPAEQQPATACASGPDCCAPRSPAPTCSAPFAPTCRPLLPPPSPLAPTPMARAPPANDSYDKKKTEVTGSWPEHEHP